MTNNRVSMRLLSSDERKNTFKEVALGYTKEEMLEEASRCLNCKNPLCVSGCPVGVNIPKFIDLLKNDKVDEAYLEIIKQNSFPGICGRVCPQEKQCEGKCIRGIKGEPVAIGRLERYASDNYSGERKEEEIKKNGKKIAIVGSGPAGLSCASEALNLGFDVTIFEALHVSGGVLSYGIPEFRLPKEIVRKEINGLITRGATIHNDYIIGRTKTIADLLEEYDGVFIGSGAGLPRFMGIPGENFNGVMSANEFLTRVNLMKGNDKSYDTPIKKMERVVVVGGGNVAMDAARVAKRIGANVTLVYRRGIDEMPARREEIEHAMEEDITFLPLTNPCEIIGLDGKVARVKCQKMALGDLDESGRRSFIPLDEYVEIKCDALIMAIGNYPNPIIKDTTEEISFSNRGLIITDDEGKTSHDSIYAGGDIVTGAATVISAMGAGKKAARALYNALINK